MDIKTYITEHIVEKYGWINDWVQTNNGLYVDTHFMRIHVYSPTDIKLCPRDIKDLTDLSKRFLLTGNGILLTNKNIEHLIDDYLEIYNEIYKICASNEYRREYPDGAWEH